MPLPPWLEDVREWYERQWSAPEPRRRPLPRWLLTLLPYLLVAAAVAVLLIAIAVKR